MNNRELLSRYRNQEPIVEIAEEAGVCRSTLMKRLRDLRERKNIEITPRLQAAEKARAAVKRLRKAGKTNQQIADELEMSRINVCKIVSKLIADGELDARVNRFNHEKGKPIRKPK